MEIVRRACMISGFHGVITYPAMKYFSSQNCALVIDSTGTSADTRLIDTLIGYELIMWPTWSIKATVSVAVQHISYL